MGKQAKDERRRDLIRCVRYADVEVGQVGFDKVANDDIEFPLFRSEDGMRVGRDANREEKEVTNFPWTRFVTSAAMRGSISMAMTCFAFSRMRTVRFPVPGPTSRTLSVGRRFAWRGSVSSVMLRCVPATHLVYNSDSQSQNKGVIKLISRHESMRTFARSGDS